jgi:hypothetical protein
MFCQLDHTKPPIVLSETTRTAIESNWQRFTTWRPISEVATLCRLLGTDGDTIRVATDVTYKEVVGLRFRQTVDEITVPFQVVTALASVRTSDGHLVLIPRNSGDWEPALECPGGFIRASYLHDDRVSVRDFITHRVMSDMQLERAEIVSVNYRATYDAKSILEYMLVYEMTLAHTKDSLTTLHPTFSIMPLAYTPQTHHHFSDKLLHPPSRRALELFERGL